MKKTLKFTDAERKVIAYAAQGVWQEIGCDVLQAIGQENGKGEGATLSKRDVIELVLDASRLEDALGRAKDGKALVTRVAKDIYGTPSEVEQFLKTDVFRYARYGF